LADLRVEDPQRGERVGQGSENQADPPGQEPGPLPSAPKSPANDARGESDHERGKEQHWGGRKRDDSRYPKPW